MHRTLNFSITKFPAHLSSDSAFCLQTPAHLHLGRWFSREFRQRIQSLEKKPQSYKNQIVDKLLPKPEMPKPSPLGKTQRETSNNYKNSGLKI